MSKDASGLVQTKKTPPYKNVVVSVPDDYKKVLLWLGLALFPLWFVIILAVPLRSKVDIVALSMSVIGQIWGLWVVGGLVLAAGAVYFVQHRKQHRRLQILDVTANGINLGRMEDNASEAVDYQVTWREIQSIHESASHGGKSWLYINSSFEVTFKIASDNAFRWISREDLIDGAIRYAPQAELALKSGGQGNVMRDLTYTNLWLEELDSSGRRKRTRPLDSGDKIGDGSFEIVKQIGAGGQGRAYLARALDKSSPLFELGHVVLKEYILPTRVIASKDKSAGRNYYVDEAMILRLLDHSGIMKIYDSFEEDYNGFLVLEYVDGTAMRNHVSNSGVCPEPQAVRIALEMCDILIYMHGLKPAVIHGDVTPENIIVEPHGRVKLIDFTVAHKFLGERKSRVAGKQGYVAPEQYAGQTVPQSDIYSLGCTLYFILSGSEYQSFDSDEDAETEPKELSVKPALKKIVEKCLAEKLTDRYGSAEELKRDLLAYAIE